MRTLRRWPALVVAITLLGLFVRATSVGAAADEATDPSGDGGSGPDITKVYWSESGTDGSQPAKVTLGFQVASASLSDADSKSHWDFDLNGDGAASEACGDIKTVGTNFQFELFKDCGQEVTATAPATHPTGGANKVEFTLDVGGESGLRAAGLSATATAYKFRVKSSVSLAGGDEVPDSTTALLTHTFGGSSATATPTPTKSPTPGPTGSPTPKPSGSPSASPSGSPAGSASPSPTPCPSPSASPSPTASASASPTASASASPSASPTPSAAASPSASPTASPTPASTACPHETVTGTPSKTNVEPGDEVQIAGNGFAASTKLDMTFQSTPKALGSITSNTSGAFATTVTIPNDATNGAHHIVVVGANTRGGTRTMMFPITVSGGADSTENTSTNGQVSSQTGTSTSSPVSLPTTGVGVAVLAGVALTLVLGGLTGASEAKLRRRGRKR